MVSAHASIAFWGHFYHWIIKNMDLETVSYFATPNHRKSRNYAQSGSQEAPKIHPKTNKLPQRETPNSKVVKIQWWRNHLAEIEYSKVTWSKENKIQ